MRAEIRNYDLWPRVAPADSRQAIHLTPRYAHAALHDGATYCLHHHLAEERVTQGPCERIQHLQPIDGALHFELELDGEQEHVLWLEEETPQGPRTVGDFRLYSLAPDLFALRPLKGDFHMHSLRSDGREAPAYVAAACREIGLDFMAVTDHRHYEPSLEARAAFAGLPVDLRIYPGEEIHPPDNPVHMVNFGGDASVNALFNSDDYRREVQARIDALGPLPSGVDPYQYASCCWCFQRVRQSGGLAIFAHPYWFWHHRYTPAGPLTDHLLRTHPFDAVEIVGGFPRVELESNALQLARYYEERAAGREHPCVGVSDAHGCHSGELFGWYHTVVLAPSADLPDLVASIRALRSVAVETLPGEATRAHGPFRLVKYVLFLEREVFPTHDALCADEGRAMFRHLEGDSLAAGELAARQGQVERLIRHAWASG